MSARMQPRCLQHKPGQGRAETSYQNVPNTPSLSHYHQKPLSRIRQRCCRSITGHLGANRGRMQKCNRLDRNPQSQPNSCVLRSHFNSHHPLIGPYRYRRDKPALPTGIHRVRHHATTQPTQTPRERSQSGKKCPHQKQLLGHVANTSSCSRAADAQKALPRRSGEYQTCHSPQQLRPGQSGSH